MEKIKSSNAMKLKITFFFTVLTVVIFAAAFLSTPAISQTLEGQKPAITEDVFARGKMLYQKQCSSCHGVTGKGDGKAAYLLYPKPRDFTRDEFRLISAADMVATDEDLFKTITEGMPGSSMPSWRSLSEEDRWGLVYYIRYLEEVGEDLKSGTLGPSDVEVGLQWPQIQELVARHGDVHSIEVPAAPSITPEGLERGRTLFGQACASCHGLEGKGDGKMKMSDSLGYPLRPRDLTAGIFKGDSSSEALYYRIVAGLPGSPMPSYAGALTEEQIWDLIHYVQTLPEPGTGKRAQRDRVNLTARKTTEALDLDPLGPRWSAANPAFVPLTPLWWRNDRVEGVEVKALHDGNQIEFHLSWPDPAKDGSAVAPQSFPDGAAIQFSTEEDPPFFAMGSSGSSVTLWHWKASWAEDQKKWQDIETQYPNAATDYYESQIDYVHGSAFEVQDSDTKGHDPLFLTGHGSNNPLSDPQRQSSAEEARAAGFGSLTTTRPTIERVDANSVWQDGKWQVVFRREINPSDVERLSFEAGKTISIAFAIWDGASGDRNGQKMVSLWNELILEQ